MAATPPARAAPSAQTFPSSEPSRPCRTATAIEAASEECAYRLPPGAADQQRHEPADTDVELAGQALFGAMPSFLVHRLLLGDVDVDSYVTGFASLVGAPAP